MFKGQRKAVEAEMEQQEMKMEKTGPDLTDTGSS